VKRVSVWVALVGARQPAGRESRLKSGRAEKGLPGVLSWGSGEEEEE